MKTMTMYGSMHHRPAEFRSGHIPEAVNVPLSAIQTNSFPKDTPLFVYCLRGARSRKAVRKMLKKVEWYVTIKKL